MNKQAISVSLRPGNLLWLQALKAGGRHRSVSEALDSLIADVRAGRARRKSGARSVRGTIVIAKSDPRLRGADAVLRSRFRTSLRSRVAQGGRASREKA